MYIFKLSGRMPSLELLPIQALFISVLTPRGQNYQLHIRCIENVILFRQFLCHSAHNMDLYFWFQASLLHLPCVLMSQEVSRTVTSTVHFWDTLWV